MNLDFLKQFFAYTDGERIYNCDPGTLVYFHEERHIQQMKNVVTRQLWDWLPVFAWIVGAISIGLVFTYKEFWALIFGGIGIAPFSVFMVFMEIDAWIYAVKKRFFEEPGDEPQDIQTP